MLRLVLCAAGLAAVVGLSTASAESLRVSPVRLDMSPGQSASTLTLRNDSDIPLNVQVRVMRWWQDNGEDLLEPTTDIVVSPPIGEVAAHSERLVRVVRLAAAPAGEQAYRLLVDELPPPPGSGERQIRVLMRHSLPLFSGASPSRDKVRWSAESASDHLDLEGTNDGGRHLRVANVRLLDGSGQEIAERQGLVGYVLAGAHVRWSFPLAAGEGLSPARLLADTDMGPIDVRLDDAS